MLNKSLFFFIWILLTIHCTSANFNTQQLQGLWQSLNDPHRALQIDQQGNYALYTDGRNLLENIAGTGHLQFKIVKTQDAAHADFNIIDRSNQSIFVKGKVEIVDAQRVRFYFFKHNDILDVADEYYRTARFGNFDKIMATFDTGKR